MHIPDGIIDGKTAATAAGLSMIGVGWALRRVKRELPPRKIPLLGLAAAFLFAAQMVNFPIAAGTSGHLIGGTLIAALLGPSAAVVVVTTVLIVQCFLFADGGVMALGANIFNMAILGSVGGYAVFRFTNSLLAGSRGRITAIAFAAWCSVVFAAISCAGQLAWSGTVSWRAAFPAMAGTHMIIGLGEGLISALVFIAIQRTRPEMIVDDTQPRRARELVVFGMVATLGIALFIAPFACPWPDGLESVAAKLGFESQAVANSAFAPLPDYQLPGMHWAIGATALAGVIGSLVVFILAMLLGWLLAPKKSGIKGNA
ncbi:MAG TPA: energy-coupling factor ABC transporter permease [Verrucomicrobiae bacterium]|jgi:cobalt/nickel transport system permease protein|nr:energy-coupling factor ABC transporter permease [Verrucomicrobiae bacterium]